MPKQHTVAKNITIEGIAVHTGLTSKICIKPADCGVGIIFKRTDLINNNYIPAIYNTVVDTSMCTVIANKYGARVATIEHLMAALWGCGVDNAIIEINCEEMPIMDGSSKVFVEMIKEAGLLKQKQSREFIKLSAPITFTNNDGYIILEPADHFSINCVIDFDHPSIGKQEFVFDSLEHSFEEMISGARTFGFTHDLEMLRSKGLAKGASLENSIGIDNTGIMNSEGLRFNNEFARHKVLDCIGDLYLAGATIKAKVKAFKPGHRLNNNVLHQMFAKLALLDDSKLDTFKHLQLRNAS